MISNLKSSFYEGPVIRTLKHIVSLLVVLLLLAATAVWTGRLWGRDIGPVFGNSVQQVAGLTPPDKEQLQSLKLDAAQVRLVPRDSASWSVVNVADDALRGVVLSSKPYANHVQGFAGPTPVYIYIDAQGRVQGTAMAENDETPDFLRRAELGTLPHWYGLTPEAGADLHVDAVSGATYTSKALIENMQLALRVYTASASTATAEPIIGWPRTVAVWAVLLLGMIAAWRYRGKKWLRIVVLLLNVGVLGFWCGQFLSLSLLRGWIANGFDPIACLPLLSVLLVALLLPFLGRHRHYCTWVCPFGSLQELAGRLPFPKIHCSPRVYKVMSHVRMCVLSLLLVLLWIGVGGFMLDYEPFAVFLLDAATPVVIILASVFVVASCFVPNVWCKACCPVGALLDMGDK